MHESIWKTMQKSRSDYWELLTDTLPRVSNNLTSDPRINALPCLSSDRLQNENSITVHNGWRIDFNKIVKVYQVPLLHHFHCSSLKHSLSDQKSRFRCRTNLRRRVGVAEWAFATIMAKKLLSFYVFAEYFLFRKEKCICMWCNDVSRDPAVEVKNLLILPVGQKECVRMWL